MTKPKSEADCGIGPFWKVRVFFAGGSMHLASRTEPVMHVHNGKVASVELDIIEGTEHGDTIGFVDWTAAVTVSWRKAGVEPPATVARPVRKARGRPRRSNGGILHA